MGIFGKIVFSGGVALLFTACAKKPQELKDIIPPAGVGPKMRSPNQNDGGRAILSGGNAQPPPINMTQQKDILWTDADNPDAGIPELEAVMAAPKKGPWEESETVARQTAAREGKPVLVWFTDSNRSPMCKILSQELFGTDKFGKWADDHVVRLRIDSNIDAAKKESMTMAEWDAAKTDVSNYVKRLKKRYKVLGHPTLLMLNPSGEVLWKDSGYKRGEADFIWGLIKQAEIASSHEYAGWRKSLEGKGYREWQGQKGRKVFAKLVSYSKGTLVLIEPGGERYRTDESKLSKDDRKWISDQKTLRGIQ